MDDGDTEKPFTTAPRVCKNTQETLGKSDRLYKYPITNAVGEGLIAYSIIKIVKNRASGYGTLDAFTDMIYLTVGDLNIPEQDQHGFGHYENSIQPVQTGSERSF